MKIPSFIKAVAKFADPTTSRYALGGILCKHERGWTSFTATDGRFLAEVTFSDNFDGEDAEVLVDAVQLAKAYQHAKPTTKSCVVPMRLSVAGSDPDTVTVVGDGEATATVVQGRFPDTSTIFDVDGPMTFTSLDPGLLRTIAELYMAASGKNGTPVDVWVPKDPTCAVRFAMALPDGEQVRVALMPKGGTGSNPHDTPFPAGATRKAAESSCC